MRKILSLTALIVGISVAVNAQPLHTSTHEEIMTGGVTLKSEQRFYGDYALNINCITADLKNENLGFELLKHSGGSDKTATVMELAKGEEKTVAAINGDFFSVYKGDQNFSLGLEVKDGKLLQSHINADMAAGFLAENVLSLSYVDFSAEVESPDGTKMAVSHINKPTDYYGALLMYTPDFNGGVSPFLPQGITAVTVTDTAVTAKGISMGGTIPIPENGYILVIDDNMTPFLEYKLNVGDEVKTSVSVTPSLENVQTAFGGGTLLLQNGEKTKITHNVSGNNPRSVIGTNADGTVIYLLTVDGRKSASRGVSLDTLADICMEMGMVNAINLDGGGSTAMVGKTLAENELHHINTPTEKRKVINALAVTSTATRGEAVGFFCNAEKDSVLSGDSVALSVTAFDKNYNTPSQIKGEPVWLVPEGGGYVKDNIYYSAGSGEVTLELQYNGKKTDTCTINVIGEVAGITANEHYELEFGKDVSLGNNVSVFDADGNTATVSDISLLNPRYDRKLVTLENNTLKVMKEGAGNLTLSHGAAQRSIKLTCGKFDTDTPQPVTTDALFRSESGGYTFDVFSAADIDTLFDRIVYARAMDTLAKADAAAVVGGEKPDDLTPVNAPIKAGALAEKSTDNAKILSLKMTDGTVTRGEQWNKLSAALNSQQKNIFVLLDSEPSFVTDIDRNAFYAMLSDSAKSKNVFVILSGSENFCRIENGVRYITVANARDDAMLHKSIANTCYLSFNITDSGVTYQFKKLFN